MNPSIKQGFESFTMRSRRVLRPDRRYNQKFQERNNCIVLRVDTCVNSEKGVNPFGFHFEFDRSKYEENKERKKREGEFVVHFSQNVFLHYFSVAVTRWLALAAFVHHKLGIRHVLLVLMMSFYAILGGFMFDALEAENERNVSKFIKVYSVPLKNMLCTDRYADLNHFLWCRSLFLWCPCQ